MFASAKNGSVVVQWLLGKPRIYAGGSQQSGPYVAGLWKDAVGRLPHGTEVASILMLGLGGACAWPMLEESFPKAEIVVVEWDETMVSLARRFKRWKKEPAIIVGDVCDVLPTLTQQFDLILDDAFYGASPEARVGTGEALDALAAALHDKGHCIINVSENMALRDTVATKLTHEATWMYRENNVAMFTH